MRRIIATAFLVAGAASVYAAETMKTSLNAEEIIPKLNVAVYNGENGMKRPQGIENWVFLGTTMGMTYFDEAPDPSDPGLFSTVFIEPSAYQEFLKTGEFVDGTVFAKVVRNTQSNGGGFFMGEELGIEVHVKDSVRFPKHGFNFYFFANGGPEYSFAMPEDNMCVECHTAEAAYDNVFTQFYPLMRKQVPTNK